MLRQNSERDLVLNGLNNFYKMFNIFIFTGQHILIFFFSLQ